MARTSPKEPPEAAEAACSFLAEAAGAAARRRGMDADAAAIALHAHEPPTPGWPRGGPGANGGGGGGGDRDGDGDVDGDGGVAPPPVIPPGTTGEDLGFSGLAANAIAASVKVISSAKRSRLQRLTVASYISAVVFDLLQQQEDPVPIAALVIHTVRKVPLKETLDLTLYPALDSLLSFADVSSPGTDSTVDCCRGGGDLRGSGGKNEGCHQDGGGGDPETARRGYEDENDGAIVDGVKEAARRWWSAFRRQKKKKKKMRCSSGDDDATDNDEKGGGGHAFEHALECPDTCCGCPPALTHDDDDDDDDDDDSSSPESRSLSSPRLAQRPWTFPHPAARLAEEDVDGTAR